jgi:DNA-binding NarL/FixJ family response regulator
MAPTLAAQPFAVEQPRSGPAGTETAPRQELQIAGLVAEGLTNRDIAA